MPSIRLKENTSVNDLATWGRNGEVRFSISRKSSFSFLVEPLAISRLYEIHREGGHIAAEILYDLPSPEQLADEGIRGRGVAGADPLPRTAAAKLGLLDTLFGLALLDTASSITQRGAKVDISRNLQDIAWNRLRSSHGLIGKGDYVAIVSRDPDMPLPPILRGAYRNDTRSFPFRDTFSDLLKVITAEMGAVADLGASSTEEALVTFLYEISRNVHEHGRFTLDSTSLNGIRGVTVRKLRALSLNELRSRSVFPVQLKSYLSRAWSPPTARGALIAVSVIDTGPGIHATLPPQRKDESDWNRLGRAFLPGESSKPPGVEGRGQGFNLVMDAFRSCAELRAFLFIHSGHLMAYRDFTDQQSERSAAQESCNLHPWDQEQTGGIGSSLTLVWPLLR